MSIEITVALMIFLLAVILTVYNHRQASALRGVERLVEDFVAMQIRDRRQKRMEELSAIDPFEWLSVQASAGSDIPIRVSEVLRVVPEVRAAEVRLKSGASMVISTLSKSEILRFDQRLRSNKKGKSAKDRVTTFAAHPLLGRSRWGWGVTTIERVMSQTNEFFDLEADAIAKRLGVEWKSPSRLWFYVVR